MGDFFNNVLVFPLLNVIAVFYKLFELIGLPGTFGLAIIAFTVFIRLLMYPLFKKQMETTRKIQELKPHLDRLNDKHKDDKTKLQQEQIRLYQEAGINPAAGCVLALVQIPIFLALYNALNFFINHSEGTANIKAINDLIYFEGLKLQTLDLTFLGYQLTTTPAQANGVWYYYLIPVITGILQYFQAVTTLTAPPKGAEDKNKKPEMGDEFQKAMQTQMKYFFPVMIGIFSFNFPVALSLYWNVFSIFSIIQYYLSHREGPTIAIKSDEEKAEEGTVIEKPKHTSTTPKKKK